MIVRGRRLLVASAVVLVVVAGALVFAAPRFMARARIGVAYVAKETCSCVFVARRPLEACRADLAPDSDPIRTVVLERERGVRAWIPWMVERTALYSDDGGCALGPFR